LNRLRRAHPLAYDQRLDGLMLTRAQRHARACQEAAVTLHEGCHQTSAW
jgi:hypothetical protein